MKYIVVYGSLKLGKYNYKRFPSQEYIKDYQLDGYELYNLGPYPAICTGKGKVKAEIHSVSDEDYLRIRRMEHGAGYSESKLRINLNKSEVEASIFPMGHEVLHQFNPKKIESGEWN